jgi:hypothetical protein
MRHNSRSICFAIVVVSALVTAIPFSAQTSAQTSEKEKEQKENEKRQELERKTVALLDEIASEAWGLKLPENRAFVQATVAELLWTRDEKRARSLFWEALNSLGLTANVLSEDAATKDSPKDSSAKSTAAKVQAREKRQQQYFEIFGRRSEFLRKVARRDPQLALDMLRATRQTPPPQINAAYRMPDDSDLEQEIATEAAERDPKKALQIARESLAKGVSFELINLVSRLNQQKQETGTEFAGDIIDKLQTVNLATELQAWWVAADLLVISRTQNNQPPEDPTPRSSRKPLKLSDDQKRELVELLTDAGLSATVNPNALQGLNEIMAEIEQFAPDRVPKLKAKMAQATQALNQNQQDWSTYNSLFRNGTPEQMIEAAATVGEEQRNTLYREAVIKAAAEGRADTLREFINNQIEDESRKKNLLDSLDEQQIGFTANQGKIESLQKLLPLIRLKERRAWAMAELAMLLEKKGEHEKAVGLLDEAQTLVKVDFKSQTQSQALLSVLLAYALVDPAKAFGIVEPIIDRANDNISKLLLLDKIVKSGAIKQGEIILSQPGIPLDFAIFKYGPGIVAVAKADFTRTKALADRFQRHELRLLARLLMVRALSSTEQVDRPN